MFYRTMQVKWEKGDLQYLCWGVVIQKELEKLILSMQNLNSSKLAKRNELRCKRRKSKWCFPKKEKNVQYVKSCSFQGSLVYSQTGMGSQDRLTTEMLPAAWKHLSNQLLLSCTGSSSKHSNLLLMKPPPWQRTSTLGNHCKIPLLKAQLLLLW